MPRNKLLQPLDQLRCTGRTTSLALAAISSAMLVPGKVVYATDHHKPGTRQAGATMYDAINKAIAQLGLEYYSVTLLSTTGQYDNHVRVVSDIWEK